MREHPKDSYEDGERSGGQRRGQSKAHGGLTAPYKGSGGAALSSALWWQWEALRERHGTVLHKAVNTFLEEQHAVVTHWVKLCNFSCSYSASNTNNLTLLLAFPSRGVSIKGKNSTNINHWTGWLLGIHQNILMQDMNSLFMPCVETKLLPFLHKLTSVSHRHLLQYIHLLTGVLVFASIAPLFIIVIMIRTFFPSFTSVLDL